MTLKDVLQKSRFIALKRFLGLVENNQEYFDWANELLMADVFFHELTMIASLEYEENWNWIALDELVNHLDCIFQKLGIEHTDEWEAIEEFGYFLSQKICSNEVSAIESIDIFYDAFYNYFGYGDDLNIWFFLHNELEAMPNEKQRINNVVISFARKYLAYYENKKLDTFFDLNHISCPTCKHDNAVNLAEVFETRQPTYECPACSNSHLFSEYIYAGLEKLGSN